MPYQKKRGLNRKPITRICIRIYDEQDAEELDKAFKSSVVQTQNDFFLGLILKAVREPSAPNQGSVDENPSDKADIKKKLDDIEREVLDSGIAAKALGEKTEEQLLEALAIGRSTWRSLARCRSSISKRSSTRSGWRMPFI
jgi:hypothetical protein